MTLPMETYLLRNANGMTVRFIAYGGSVVSIEVPDRHGTVRDVVLGYDSLDGYENDRRAHWAVRESDRARPVHARRSSAHADHQ
jgi:galactose mutarotase-like enzyme